MVPERRAARATACGVNLLEIKGGFPADSAVLRGILAFVEHQLDQRSGDIPIAAGRAGR